ARHHCRLEHGLMFYEHALEFKRTYTIIGGLEDIIHPADVSYITLGIANRYIAGVIVAAGECCCRPLGVIEIPLHEAKRTLRQINTDLPLLCELALTIHQHNGEPWKRTTHGAGF